MIKQEVYDKINSCLNDMVNKQYCIFDVAILKYQDLLLAFSKLSTDSLIYLDQTHDFYELNLDLNRKKYVSSFETISIAREIIKEISDISEIDYVGLFDDIIYKLVNLEVNDIYGEREITWDHTGHDPYHHIDIHLNGNYDDVHTLVHEFFHLANSYGGTKNINRTMLTEAVSIYFEMYAVDYMLKNDICKPEELDTTWRLRDHYRLCDSLYNCGAELAYFNFVGHLSDESYDYIYEKWMEMPREKYEEDIMCLHDIILKNEEKYEKEKYDYPGVEKHNYVVEETKSNYVTFHYILGTYIAAYIRKYGSVLDACYLSERIKNGFEVDTLFERIGLDMDELISECNYTCLGNENIKPLPNPLFTKITEAFDEYADEMINYIEWPKKRTISR